MAQLVWIVLLPSCSGWTWRQEGATVAHVSAQLWWSAAMSFTCRGLPRSGRTGEKLCCRLWPVSSKPTAAMVGRDPRGALLTARLMGHYTRTLRKRWKEHNPLRAGGGSGWQRPGGGGWGFFYSRKLDLQAVKPGPEDERLPVASTEHLATENMTNVGSKFIQVV